MIIQEFLTLLGYKVDDKGLKRYERSTERTISRTRRLIGGAVVNTLRWGTAITGVVAGLTAREFLNANQTFERLQAQLETLEGSTDKAAQKFRFLQKYAASTPFELAEVVGLYNRLTAAGFKITERELTAIGNLAAQSGRSLDESSEIILSASRGLGSRVDNFFGLAAKAQGGYLKVSSEALKITKKIKTGDKKALIEFFTAAGEAPGVAGAVAKRAKTIEGAISNVKDSLFQFYVQVGSSSGLRGEIQGLARDISASVQEGDELATVLGKYLARGVGKLRQGVAWLRAHGPDTIEKLLDISGRLRIELERHKPLLRTLGALFVGLRLAQVVQNLGFFVGLAGKGVGVLTSFGGALGLSAGAAGGLLGYLLLLAFWLADVVVFLRDGTSLLSQWAVANRDAGGVTGATAASLYNFYGSLLTAQQGIKKVLTDSNGIIRLRQELSRLEGNLRRLGPVGVWLANNLDRIGEGILTLLDPLNALSNFLRLLPLLTRIVVGIFAGWVALLNRLLEALVTLEAQAPRTFRALATEGLRSGAGGLLNPLGFATEVGASALGDVAHQRAAGRGVAAVNQTNSSQVTIHQTVAGGEPGQVAAATQQGVGGGLKDAFSDVKKNLEGALE